MPKRRRLKSAPHTYTNPTPAVHDRRATELPAGAVVGVVEIDDPFARGERISAVASLRDDPLGALWARHQIDDAKYVAGRHWQKLYEAAELGNLRAWTSPASALTAAARGSSSSLSIAPEPWQR